MLESTVNILNHAASLIEACLFNSAPATLCAVVVIAAYARCRSLNAATRYGLWWLTLGFVIAAPFISTIFPENHVSVVKTVVPVHNSLPAAAVTSAPRPERTRFTAPAIVLLLWLSATFVQLIRLIRSLLFGFRLKRITSTAPDHLERLFTSLTATSNIQRPVTLKITHNLASPAVVGYRHPQVMLPSDLAARLEVAELEQILLHELAHIARYDDWAIAIQRLIEAIYALHPFVSYLCHRLNQDRESSCDDRVAAYHQPKRYAACLTKVAGLSGFAPREAMLVPLLERKSGLLSRVEALLDKTRNHAPQLSIIRLAGIFILLAILAFAGSQAPRLMAMPAPLQKDQGISAIVVRSADGKNSSEFGSCSGEKDCAGEPGAIKFNLDNKTYVIRDKSIVDQASKIVQSMDDLTRKQIALSEQQSDEARKQLAELEALKLNEKQIQEAINQANSVDQHEIEQELANAKAGVDKLNEKQIEKQIQEAINGANSVDQREIEQQLANAKAGVDKLQSGEIEAQLKQIDAAEQHVLSDQLSKLQAGFGDRQSKEAERIERQLKSLIDQARKQGLAQEVPEKEK